MTATTALRSFRLDALTGARAVHDPVVVYDTITGSGPRLNVGACWAGLHVLITAGDPPIPRDVALSHGFEWDDDSFENVLMGGDATEYEDALSVARYLAPPRVEAMSARLAGLSADEVSARFDESVFDYLPSAQRSMAVRGELVARYSVLVRWYASAAAAGDGLLLYVGEVAMKQLIRVGFYKDLRHGRKDGESLRESLQSTPGPDDKRLVAYLRGGTPMVVAAGIVRDVLDNSVIGGLDIRTDGTYAWPSDFPHYIEKHRARPPAELLEHARTLGFVCPTDIDVGDLQLPKD